MDLSFKSVKVHIYKNIHKLPQNFPKKALVFPQTHFTNLYEPFFSTCISYLYAYTDTRNYLLNIKLRNDKILRGNAEMGQMKTSLNVRLIFQPCVQAIRASS